jgi:hypothetical protein
MPQIILNSGSNNTNSVPVNISTMNQQTIPTNSNLYNNLVRIIIKNFGKS